MDKHSLFPRWGSGAECYLSKEIGIRFGGCFVHQGALELRRSEGQGTVPLLPCASHPHRPWEAVASQLWGGLQGEEGARAAFGIAAGKGAGIPVLQNRGLSGTWAEWQRFVSLLLLEGCKEVSKRP